MKLQTRKFPYKWVIAAACFMMVFICDGFAGGYRGLYLTAVSDGLGVSRTMVSVEGSLRFLTGAIMAMLYGPLTNRFSARKLIGAGFAILTLSLVVYSRVDNVYVFWAAGILMGIGLSFLSTTMVSSLIQGWFDNNEGSVLGFVLAASGIGSAVGSQIISPILYSGDPMGFQYAYGLTAIVIAVAALVIPPLLRERFFAENKTTGGESVEAEQLAGKVSKLCFGLVVGCVFLVAACIMGVNSIYVSHMLDVGIDAGTAGRATGILSLSLIASKLLTGVLYDRLGLRPVLGICQVATLISFSILLFLNQASTVAALIFPAVFAFALPLETIMIPLIVSDVFGKKAFQKMIGIFSAVTAIGFMVSSPVSNLVYDSLGSYTPAIVGYGGVMIIVSFVLQTTITWNKRRNCHE